VKTPNMETQVLVMAKSPRPGHVKTRLCPPLSHATAAAVARAALMDTLDSVVAARPSRATVVLDGEVGSWLRPGVHVIPQRSGPFTDRLEGAIEDAFAAFPTPILLVGMDTPQMTPDHLTTAAETLLTGDTDSILGRADDGGFWIIGVRQPVAGLCNSVPMSTATTGTHQLAQLSALGLRCSEVNCLRDVDVMEDALAVAAAAPRSRFAAVLRSCGAIPNVKVPVGVA
jgi:rSAM/selenodomain-associated transferase 1